MSLRLATFNLKDFFAPRPRTAAFPYDEAPIAEAKLASVAASLRRARADVVALQEVASVEMLSRLLAEVPELGYGEPIVGTPDRRLIRNVILSRMPILWSQVHQAKSLPFPRFVAGDPDPFPDRIPLRRGVVHVRVDTGALGEVDILAAHFKSGLPAPLKGKDGQELPDMTPHDVGQSAVRSLVQRAAEALFVRELVDAVFAKLPDHMICVMGDLNDSVDSLPVRLVAGVDVEHRHHLRACANMIDAAHRFSVLHGGRRGMIDHVLVSERLHRALRSYEIHNEELRDHGPHVDGAPMTEDSDHALCLAHFHAPGTTLQGGQRVPRSG